MYRQRMYALHVGENGISRHRDVTPQRFAAEKGLVSRARMWIRRELRVFFGVDPTARRCVPLAERVLDLIVAMLGSVDLLDSHGRAEDLLSHLFGGRDVTRHFLHELRAWLRSPCQTLEEWDRTVQYKEPRVRSP